MPLLIRPAVESDLEDAIGLLEAAGLPTRDLSGDHLAFVAENDAAKLGFVGVERYQQTGLLRSLIISEDARGQGIGSALVSALEVDSASRGVQDLWLLTIDADVFFSRLGYRVRERQQAPAAVQRTEEFTGLCPGDAVLMSKQITPNR